MVRLTSGVLESYREAYLIAARTGTGQSEWPISQRALIDRMRRQFATALLLGETRKPEGASVVTFGNALSRFAELGHVELVRRGRERLVERGPGFDRLPELVRQLRD